MHEESTNSASTILEKYNLLITPHHPGKFAYNTSTILEKYSLLITPHHMQNNKHPAFPENISSSWSFTWLLLLP
jgi:hypothetical protein